MPEGRGVGDVFPVEGESCPAAKRPVSQTVIFIVTIGGARKGQGMAGLNSCTGQLRFCILVGYHCAAPYFQAMTFGNRWSGLSGLPLAELRLEHCFLLGKRARFCGKQPLTGEAESASGNGDTCPDLPHELRKESARLVSSVEIPALPPKGSQGLLISGIPDSLVNRSPSAGI
jgi:hypothetical protein